MSAALLADIARLSRDRDDLADQLARQRRRWIAACDEMLRTLEPRPELEHTHHRAA